MFSSRPKKGNLSSTRLENNTQFPCCCVKNCRCLKPSKSPLMKQRSRTATSLLASERVTALQMFPTSFSLFPPAMMYPSSCSPRSAQSTNCFSASNALQMRARSLPVRDWSVLPPSRKGGRRATTLCAMGDGGERFEGEQRAEIRAYI
jgi:hypothetical protein